VGSPGYGAGVGADLDAQRYARDRGNQRFSGGGNSFQGTGNSFQGSGNRYNGGGVGSPPPSSGGGYSGSRPVGGYRSSLGAGRGGGRR
jgi:hypothetical protein